MSSKELKVFTPNLDNLVNMNISKTDILNIFEEDLRTELTKKCKDLNEKKKAEEEKIKGLEKSIIGLIKPEENSYVQQVKRALNFSKTPLSFRVDVTVGNRMVYNSSDENQIECNVNALFVISKKDNIGRRGYDDDLVLTINLAPEIKKQIAKIQTEISDVSKKAKIFDGMELKYRSDLDNLSTQVKKFSAQMTKEALGSLPKGQDVLKAVQKLTDKFKAEMELKRLK